jgi:uncharacterized protein (TIGR03086 family)
MAGQCGPDPLPPGAIALLGGAIRYTLGVCAQVAQDELSRPTPCPDWDLAALLAHLALSMADLESGLRTGSVDPWAPDSAERAQPADPAEVVRDQAANLLFACYAHHGGDRFVQVGGVPLTAGIVAATAAMEIAVHGWDVAVARGASGEIPPGLAGRLLRLGPLLVVSRSGLFAPAVEVPSGAGPSDRLVAYLGRDPLTGPAG